jgi:NitT/TauT family transport system substrate-binding protein
MGAFVRRSASLLWTLFITGSALLTAAPACAEVKEFRVGFGYGLTYLPIMVADAQGYFTAQAKEAGVGDLTLSIRRFSGLPALNEALVSGNIDAAAVGTPGFLILWDKTRSRYDMRALVALAAHVFVVFTNQPRIKSLADFADQDKIAMPAPTSPQGILIRMAAEQFYGMGQYARLDSLMISLPHPEAVAALLAGKVGVTGYVATPPYIATLSRSDKVHAVITSRDILGPEDATGAVLTVGRAFVENNPGVCKAVLAALEKAIAFIAREPDKAADIYLKFEPSAKIAKQDVLEMLTDGSMSYSVAPSGVERYARFMARTGQLKNEPKSWRDVFFPFIHDRNGS